MAQINAGRVRFIGRGEYNNSTQYYVFDFVNYNGNSYFAKQNTQGNLPTNTTYWQLVAEKGNTGDTGATGNGIASVTKTSTTGLVDTYTITFTDGNTTTFDVTNGNGIDHISLTSQSGATKVYTIYYTDGNTTTFTVQDGEVTQEVFDEEIERANMIYNAMPKVSGEGTDLTLNNTAECPVYDIELSPSELEQETTTGKNLMPTSLELMKSLNTTGTWNNDVYTLNDVTWTPVFENNELQYVNANGTASGDSAFSIGRLENPENNQYIGTGCPANGSDSTYRMFFSNMGSDFGNGIIRTITDITRINCSATIYDGYTASNLVYYPMLRLSSVADATYEPFTNGASPNPQYPQQIHTVSGENSVKVGNKNLIDINTSNQIVYSNSYNNFTLSNGILTTSGNTLVGYKVKVNPNTQYTAQLFGTLSGGTNALRIREYSGEPTDWDTNFIIQNVTTITNNTTSSLTVTTSASTEWLLFVIYSNTSGLVCENMQLELGSTASSYVPHKSQSLPLSLGDLEYCKIGDYEDLFFKNVVGSEYYDSTLVEDKWYLKKNVGKVVLNGTQAITFTDWRASATSVGWVYPHSIANTPTISSTSDIGFIKSNKLIEQTYANMFNKSVDTGISLTNSNSYSFAIRTSDTTLTTESAINTYLSNNPITTYYALATPTNTLLSDTLQTQLDNLWNTLSYQGQTNVSQTNADLPFVIKLSAIRDLSGIFELIQ